MNESGTFLGYLIACPTPGCGNPDAYLVPEVTYLNGIGEAGMVRYEHRIDCTSCDNSDIATPG